MFGNKRQLDAEEGLVIFAARDDLPVMGGNDLVATNRALEPVRP